MVTSHNSPPRKRENTKLFKFYVIRACGFSDKSRKLFFPDRQTDHFRTALSTVLNYPFSTKDVLCYCVYHQSARSELCTTKNVLTSLLPQPPLHNTKKKTFPSHLSTLPELHEKTLLTFHVSAARLGGLSLSSSRRGRRAWALTSWDSFSLEKTAHIPSLILHDRRKIR